MKHGGFGIAAARLRFLVPVALWAATARTGLASVVAFCNGIPSAAPPAVRSASLSPFGRRSTNSVAFLARSGIFAAAQGANLLKVRSRVKLCVKKSHCLLTSTQLCCIKGQQGRLGSCVSPGLRGGGAGAAGAAHMSAAASASGVDSLDQLAKNADHSWLAQLNAGCVCVCVSVCVCGGGLRSN